MKTKQNAFNAMLVVITMGLLCWNIKLQTDIRATQSVLAQTRERALMNSNAINDGKGLNIQLFQMGQRVDNVESWIWNFEDIMFGAPEETPATE